MAERAVEPAVGEGTPMPAATRAAQTGLQLAGRPVFHPPANQPKVRQG